MTDHPARPIAEPIILKLPDHDGMTEQDRVILEALPPVDPDRPHLRIVE